MACVEYELAYRCTCGIATQGAGNDGLEFRSRALNCSEESEGDMPRRGEHHKFSHRMVSTSDPQTRYKGLSKCYTGGSF